MKTYTFLEMSNQKVAISLNESDAIEFAKQETKRKKALDPSDNMPIYYPIVVDDETGLLIQLSDVGPWYCKILINDERVFEVYGRTRDVAESNARIAAKGYLVEEMIPYLEDHLDNLRIVYKEDGETITGLKELLTKAKL